MLEIALCTSVIFNILSAVALAYGTKIIKEMNELLLFQHEIIEEVAPYLEMLESEAEENDEL